MKTIKNITILGLLATLTAFAQYNTLTQATTAAAMTANTQWIVLSSATGISVPGVGTVGTQLFVVDVGQVAGEVMNVLEVSSGSALTFKVRRSGGGAAVAHASGAMVLAGAPNLFKKVNPSGSCTLASTEVTPLVNTMNGLQWLCSAISLTWVPGFGNLSAPAQATAVHASGTAAMVVSGPLFHVSGTSAVTSIVVPVGAAAGAGFCVIWDSTGGATAGNNIVRSTQGAAGLTTCFTYNAADAKYEASN